MKDAKEIFDIYADKFAGIDFKNEATLSNFIVAPLTKLTELLKEMIEEMISNNIDENEIKSYSEKFMLLLRK